MQQTKIFFPALRAAFPKTVPVLIGFLTLGAAYGILMSISGYGVLWSFLMSAIAFCGSMQYVAITLLTSVYNPLYAFLLALMVNARHLFYGISMLEKLHGTGKAKPLLIFWLCDETFSILCDAEPPETVHKTAFYTCIAALDYFYWILGTLLGGVLGNLIQFNTKGLDFVLTALFVVIFLDQWQSQKKHSPAITGILCTLACLLVFGQSLFLIPSMLLILAVLSLAYRKECKKEAAGK